MTSSRPSSLALMPPASASPDRASPPSLRQILTNTALPPYTLGAFMTFLSQNHCLETLEFTMDTERYRTAYFELHAGQTAGTGDGTEHVCSLWQKLMRAYILPYGPREVNLPAHVRDRLLSLPATVVPPDPSELDEAARIVYELMNDSVLGPFLASVSLPPDEAPETEAHDPKQARSRLRLYRESSNSEDSNRSPIPGFLPLLNIAWTSEARNSSASSSSDPTDRQGGLTDHSANTASPTERLEPMTPPTTPPSTDLGFSTSPGSFHRAITAHNNGWKKMGAKLGLSRKGRNKQPTSAGPASDSSLSDPSQNNSNPQ
ncbi:regulator of G protein signaling superfamily [Canariomyces notabilis]|uniref:Regulator of G protein signaling superfamily n=1 Tax=Canariomyces notabilis TaxID=2074819 RepID=A0AAN6TKA7_9PEZI|nr:regulator of G protein signaling superfamily [Canariomyces arenarius]